MKNSLIPAQRKLTLLDIVGYTELETMLGEREELSAVLEPESSNYVYPVNFEPYFGLLKDFLLLKGIEADSQIRNMLTFNESEAKKFLAEEPDLAFTKMVYHIGIKIAGKYSEKQNGWPIGSNGTAMDVIFGEVFPASPINTLLERALNLLEPLPRTEIFNDGSGIWERISNLITGDKHQYFMPFVLFDCFPVLHKHYDLEVQRRGEAEGLAGYVGNIKTMLGYLEENEQLHNDVTARQKVRHFVSRIVTAQNGAPEYRTPTTDDISRYVDMQERRALPFDKIYEQFILEFGTLAGLIYEMNRKKERKVVELYLSQLPEPHLQKVSLDYSKERKFDTFAQLFIGLIRAAQKAGHLDENYRLKTLQSIGPLEKYHG